MREFNPEMSRKYGIKVYNFENPKFPFWVDGMFEDEEGCTEAEIKDFVDWHQNENLWASEIIGWYVCVREDPERHPELEDVIDELNWYLETMYGHLDTSEQPDWLRDYLFDIDENFGAPYDVWIPIIDRVISHLD